MSKLIIEKNYKAVEAGLQVPNNDFNIFIGANNSGKTSLLGAIHKKIGRANAVTVSPQRFNINPNLKEDDRERFDDYVRTSKSKGATHNGSNEVSLPNFIQLFAGMERIDSNRLIAWINNNFPINILRREDTSKGVTKTILEIDGQPPDVQGTGLRSLMNLLFHVFSSDNKVLLIDEPEISIEPEKQKILFDLLKNVSQGQVDGVEKKQIFIATHSHLFLDRQKISNNYLITKDSLGKVEIYQLKTENEFYTKVFSMIGVTPQDMFLPNNILVVEGPSDYFFLREVVNQLNNTGKVIAIHHAESDSRICGACRSIDDILKIPLNPEIFLYRGKLCVLFDKQKRQQYVEDARKAYSDDGSRIRQLTKGPIELYYPPKIVSRITGIDSNNIEKALMKFVKNCKKSKDGRGKLGQNKFSKVELAKKVVEKMKDSNDWELNQEIEDIVNKVIKLGY